jgi:hypothetical protein
MPWNTGLHQLDAETDFQRVRRRQVLAALAGRLRREPDDINLILPFDEVVRALGRKGERELGLQTIPLETIVGTVDRARDFDRRFRPRSNRLRERWQGIDMALRRGRGMPPISVYRIGDLHFVRDGHHRVSVARAQKRPDIDAYVTEVSTRLGADQAIRPGDLPLKSHLRVFLERVPLSRQEAQEVRLSDPWAYGALAEGVEAWGFRHTQGCGESLSREEVAQRWLDDEFRPVVQMLRAADLTGDGTDADAYMRIASERYRLMRTHDWNDAVIERLRQELR